mmetsp:Transcript_32838/g.49532  ORF Transcript_32838/g.49532 Transcript_32838/m.49532 type:complete len:735 (+) Transcript_32838:140-2344(+)
MPNHSDEGHVVRHSGRAHVRGKIRRVWRPRYLELMDNGLVRYFECENTNPLDDDNSSYQVSTPPKCTLKIYHARIIDVTTLRDVHVGLPRGTYGFLFHGLKASLEDGCGRGSLQDSPTPRDFLCAVATLEEAQSWVVALQWATSLRRSDWEEMDDDLFATTSTLFTGCLDIKKLDSVTADRQQTRTTKSPPKKTLVGKTVVPKVHSVNIVRKTGTTMQIAYKIQLLVLQKKERSPIEERSLLRTSSEIDLLLKRLMKDTSSNTEMKVRSLKEKLDLQKFTSYRDYIDSISAVDFIFRTLAMDAHICNSAPLRAFWSLDTFCQQSHWDIHRSDSVLKLCHHQPPSTESFVKNWLQEGKFEQQSILKEYFYSFLLQKTNGMTGVLVFLFVIVRPVRFIDRFFGSIRISLDVFLLSIFVAFWVGKEFEKSHVLKSTKRKSRKVASTEDSINVSDMSGDICSNHSVSTEEDVTVQSLEYEADENSINLDDTKTILTSPLPRYPENGGISCWSKPKDRIFHVRSASYLRDRAKEPSGPAPFDCRGVDIWLTDNPERNIARHPGMMGGCLEEEDTFLVNFLLPFGNLVAYFKIPPIEDFPQKVGDVWSKFITGDQEYRDARLKLLPVVVEGPWIVKAAVGSGKSPALLGKVIPLQYFFRHATETSKAIYEVDIIITASSIAKGILSVVKGHTRSLTIAFGFIIEAAEEEELPESVLCNFQLHELNLEYCPQLPNINLNEM